MYIYVLAFACVLGIAAGQILFKLAANSMNQANSILDLSTLSILGSALALYGITTLGWVWVLQRIELGRVYPLMALAFILVPIASNSIFGEQFSVQYFIGVLLIGAGVILTVMS